MWNSKVVWSEGMFLQPHHFQQQDRYFESLVEGRCGPLTPFPWGFEELKLEDQQLALGKISITRARGILPDGTPFNFPADIDPPEPLDVSEQTRDQLVVLALPLRRPAMEEVTLENKGTSLARFAVGEYEARDSIAEASMPSLLQVARPRLRLVLGSEPLSAYACIGVARIDERRPDGKVLLDEDYIAPVLDCRASQWLRGIIVEISGALHSRGDALASISSGATNNVAQMTDFVLLQTFNRYEPLFNHFREVAGLHPEGLFRACVMLAGDLAVFHKKKRCPAFPPYRHDDLAATFAPLVDDIRESLDAQTIRHAVSIPIEKAELGFWAARVPDRQLLRTATFVLAASARRPTEEMRQVFPTVVQIGPGEHIGALAEGSLPGIKLHPVPVHPPAIPFYTGYTYFELDRTSEYWKMLDKSSGLALHVAEELPELRLALWAIREQRS